MELSPLLITKGKDPSHLILAFGGVRRGALFPSFEFFETTGSLEYSRILVNNSKQCWYHSGISDEVDTFDKTLEVIRIQIDRLKPKTVCAVGTSAGAYAAILFGYLLKVDTVHAFAPQTNIKKKRLKEMGDGRFASDLAAVYKKGTPNESLYDLRELLQNDNGKTRFNIHICEGNRNDIIHAEWVIGLPGVTVLRYKCRTHNVGGHLRDTGKLKGLLSK